MFQFNPFQAKNRGNASPYMSGIANLTGQMNGVLDNATKKLWEPKKVAKATKATGGGKGGRGGSSSRTRKQLNDALKMNKGEEAEKFKRQILQAPSLEKAGELIGIGVSKGFITPINAKRWSEIAERSGIEKAKNTNLTKDEQILGINMVRRDVKGMYHGQPLKDDKTGLTNMKQLFLNPKGIPTAANEWLKGMRYGR